MSILRHTDFLQSDDAYADCAKFWKDLLSTVIAELGDDPAEWQPWLPRRFANGTPFSREDLPILEVRSIPKNRALRVQQWEAKPSDESGVLAVWVDDYSGFDETFPECELFLSVLLDGPVAKVVKTILSEWCKPGMDLQQFKIFLANNQVASKNDEAAT